MKTDDFLIESSSTSKKFLIQSRPWWKTSNQKLLSKKLKSKCENKDSTLQKIQNIKNIKYNKKSQIFYGALWYNYKVSDWDLDEKIETCDWEIKELQQKRKSMMLNALSGFPSIWGS